MKYLKISSNSRTTVEDLFTLGVSTSRGDDGKIGQFGSGTLMGVLAWMRTFGKAPVFMVNGKQVKFEAKPVLKSDGNVFRQVLMNGKPLSVALEYGELDWKTPELGLREWICNAIDAGASLADCLTIVNGVKAEDDEIAVFVPYNEVAERYFANIDQYFLHFRKMESCKMVPKNGLSKCRIFRKGVFVRELSENSLFDYNLNFDINECRTGSSDSLLWDIRTHIANYCDHKEDIFKAILAGTDCLETNLDLTYHSLSDSWKPILAQSKAKLSMPGIHADGATCVAAGWYTKITKLVPELDGLIKTSSATLKGFEAHAVPEITQKNFDKVCGAIEAYNMANGLERPKLEVYSTKDGSQPGMLGYYDTTRKTVGIWLDNQTSLTTVVHELCHHYSKADDGTRAFVDYAHGVIAAIIA